MARRVVYKGKARQVGMQPWYTPDIVIGHSVAQLLDFMDMSNKAPMPGPLTDEDFRRISLLIGQRTKEE